MGKQANINYKFLTKRLSLFNRNSMSLRFIYASALSTNLTFIFIISDSINVLTTTFSISVIITSASTGTREPLILTPINLFTCV